MAYAYKIIKKIMFPLPPNTSNPNTREEISHVTDEENKAGTTAFTSISLKKKS